MLALFEHPTWHDDRGTAVIVDRRGREVARSVVHWALEGMAWSREESRVVFGGTSASHGSYTAMTAYSMDLHSRLRLELASAGGITLQDISAGHRWLVTHDERSYRLLVGDPGAGQERDLSWLEISETPAISADGKLSRFPIRVRPAASTTACCCERRTGRRRRDWVTACR